MILLPQKRLVHPKNLFVTTADLIRQKEVRPEDIALDLHITLALNEKGKCLGKRTFRCNSFVANWMRMFRGAMFHTDENVYNAYNGVAYESESKSTVNFRVVYSNPKGYFCGPVIGTGTTAHTATDVRMQKQITHGSVAPSASVLTGTTHATYSTVGVVYDNGGNPGIANDLYNYYILEITSGALNGHERIIIDTINSTPDYFYINESTYHDMDASFASEPDAVTYKIKTYGQMTHGSTALTAPEDDGDLTSTMTITRSFANGSGVTQNVTEFGLITLCYGTTALYPYRIYSLIAHDVIADPAPVENGQELTLTYTFACEA